MRQSWAVSSSEEIQGLSGTLSTLLPPPSVIDTTQFFDSDIATPMFVGNSDFSIQDFVEQAKLNTQEFWIESSGIMSALKKAAGKNTESIEYKIFSTVFHMGIVSGISTWIDISKMSQYITSRSLAATPAYQTAFNALEASLVEAISSTLTYTSDLFRSATLSSAASRWHESLIMKWLKYPEIFTNYHITRLPPAPEDRFPGVDILIRLHQCDELIRSHSIKHSLADRAVQILSTPISRLYGNR